MKKLQYGKMTTKELAEWFNKSTRTITQNNWDNKYISVLSQYCDFVKVYGGIEIIHIYHDEFIPFKDKVKDLFDKVFDKEWNNKTGLDSIGDVVNRIIEKNSWIVDPEQGGYSYATVYAIGAAYRTKFYGKPFEGEGELGFCKYILCTRDKTTGELRFLTDEEKALKKITFNKYFANPEEATILTKQLIEEGIISQANAWEYYETFLCRNKGGWGGFFQEMKDKGCILYRGTLVTRNGFKYIVKADEFKWDNAEVSIEEF